jgi:hypothetical protein
MTIRMELQLAELFGCAELASGRSEDVRNEHILDLWFMPGGRAARGHSKSYQMPDRMLVFIYRDSEDHVVFIEIERKTLRRPSAPERFELPWARVYESISRWRQITGPVPVRIAEGEVVLTRNFDSVYGAVVIGLNGLGQAIWMELPAATAS